MSDKTNNTPDEITDEQLESVAGGCQPVWDPETGQWVSPTIDGEGGGIIGGGTVEAPPLF